MRIDRTEHPHLLLVCYLTGHLVLVHYHPPIPLYCASVCRLGHFQCGHQCLYIIISPTYAPLDSYDILFYPYIPYVRL